MSDIDRAELAEALREELQAWADRRDDIVEILADNPEAIELATSFRTYAEKFEAARADLGVLDAETQRLTRLCALAACELREHYGLDVNDITGEMITEAKEGF